MTKDGRRRSTCCLSWDAPERVPPWADSFPDFLVSWFPDSIYWALKQKQPCAKNRMAEISSPFGGITRIRFKGFDRHFSPIISARRLPRSIEIKSRESEVNPS
jgi:hypothetical protein